VLQRCQHVNPAWPHAFSSTASVHLRAHPPLNHLRAQALPVYHFSCTALLVCQPSSAAHMLQCYLAASVFSLLNTCMLQAPFSEGASFTLLLILGNSASLNASQAPNVWESQLSRFPSVRIGL
jgi:hypothetical protein